MSLKSLALLVFLLISGVFASAHCYLAGDRNLHPQPAAKCCNTVEACPICRELDCQSGLALGESCRRTPPRISFSGRRREATVLGTWIPCNGSAATTTDTHGS